MAYSNRFVVNVLVNGQIQKELQSGQVGIPFGSEYALRFRNKHNRRACVKFFIDGENVSGNGYIIPANDYVDIERHHAIDRAFKFVELDSLEAQDAGKNGPNIDGSKGVVEARFYLEKKNKWVQKPIEHHWHYYNTWPTLNNPYVPPAAPGYSCDQPEYSTWSNCSNDASGSTLRSCSASDSIPEKITISDKIPSVILCSVPPMQDGVTVEGNSTGQCFSSAHINLEDNFTTIKIVLKGIAQEECRPIVPVPQGSYCTNCGAKRDKKAKFCGQCGTKLT